MFLKYITSRVCKKMDLGLNGNLFGGNMMAWMDEAAFIYAKMTTGERYIVTLKFGEIIFKQPVKEGDIVSFYVDEDKTLVGESSISFEICGKIGESVIFDTMCKFVAVTSLGQTKRLDMQEVIKHRENRGQSHI